MITYSLNTSYLGYSLLNIALIRIFKRHWFWIQSTNMFIIKIISNITFISQSLIYKHFIHAYILKYWHKHAVQGNLIYINVLNSVLCLAISRISKAVQRRCSLNISSETRYCRPKPWLPDLKETSSNIKTSYQEENVKPMQATACI